MQSCDQPFSKQNHTVPDNARQTETKFAPDIDHELIELYRRILKQRNSGLRNNSVVATPNQMSSHRTGNALPAPVRFTRKSKPEVKKTDVGAKQSICESPVRTAQQSLESSSTSFDETYDALLQKLMIFDETDRCRMDMPELGSLDAHLNEFP